LPRRESNSQLIEPRKLPRQARSNHTVQAILEAAAKVLSQGSLQALNTNRVAEVAGVSIGTLYQYFPNKSALVARLIANAQRELVKAIESAVEQSADQPFDVALRALLQTAIAQQFGNPLLAAALDHEEIRLADALNDVQDENNAQSRLIQCVASLISRAPVKIESSALFTIAMECLQIAKELIDDAGRLNTRPPDDLLRRVGDAVMARIVKVNHE
jgi:AcrR family transcriptional regulator